MNILINNQRRFDNQNDEPQHAIREQTPIQKFYDGKTILITGGTGFIGKLLIEKLLTACPGIKKIYLLIRLKFTHNTQQRFQQLFDLPLFNNLKREQPNAMNKVELVKGDLGLPNLHLTYDDRMNFIEEIDMIFNCGAATIWDSNLRTSSDINVRGLNELLNLAKEMKNLKALIHISSVFVACTKQVLDESFQTPLISSEALLEFIHSMDKNVRHSKPIYLGKWPNNYLFTKCIGEELLRKKGDRLPITIVRFPQVLPTYQYPMAGWCDDTSGLIGLIITLYIGLNKSVLAEKLYNAHVIPADMAVNVLMVAGYDLAMKFVTNCNQEVMIEEDSIPIYNVGGDLIKPITWGEFFKKLSFYVHRNPTEYQMCHPWHLVHSNMNLHAFICIVMHYIPAYFNDFFTFYITGSAKYLAYYNKTDALTRSLNFYFLNDWEVRNENCMRLWTKLNYDDRQLFNFNLTDINWDNYFKNVIHGLRINVLRDEDNATNFKIYYRQLCMTLFKITLFILFLIYIIY